jgi:4-amino-4-deoxy-L-arabinose transferase-like glycosyltransferase
MRSRHNILLVIIILAGLVIGASTLTRGHEWGDDFAAYIMQAQSILDGKTNEFIERNTFTIFESDFQIGPVAYPWGYPIVLIPSLLLKGLHHLTLKLPGLFFFAAFLFCLYQLTKDRISRTERLILVSLFAFNPILTKHLDYIMSDIPFLFSVFITLLLIEKWKSESDTRKYIVIGLSIFFAFFLRTTGIILLGSFLAYQAVIFITQKERRKTAVINSAIVGAVFVMLWLLSNAIFPNGQSAYFRQLMGFTLEKFINEFVPGYFYLGAQFLGIQPNSSWIYVYYALVIIFVIGAWAHRREDTHILLFFILYYSAMVIWPEWQGIRFVFPVLPIFIYFAFQGINFLIKKLPERSRPVGTWASSLLWIVLAGVFLFISGTRAYSNLNNNRDINGPFESFSDEVFRFIQNETPSDSVIIFFKPRALRLFTDRNSIMVLECESLLKGDYFAQHKNWEFSQILPKDLPECDLPLTNVFENRKYIVYEIPK